MADTKSTDVPEKLQQEIKQGRLEQLKDMFSGCVDASAIKESVTKELSYWKKVVLNIGVIGESGSGKSSLINAMLGITADDHGAAKVGSTETTMDCTSYPHPKYNNLVMWDLPGVGTPKFLKDNYLEAIQFKKYDFFLIVSHTRFSENDMWLAKKIQDKRMKFYFIRTKADCEVVNDRKAHPRTHNKVKLLNSIKEDCIDQLQASGIGQPDVFLVNSYHQGSFDFEKMQLKLIKDAPARIKDALVLSFPAFPLVLLKKRKLCFDLESGRWQLWQLLEQPYLFQAQV